MNRPRWPANLEASNVQFVVDRFGGDFRRIDRAARVRLDHPGH